MWALAAQGAQSAADRATLVAQGAQTAAAGASAAVVQTQAHLEEVRRAASSPLRPSEEPGERQAVLDVGNGIHRAGVLDDERCQLLLLAVQAGVEDFDLLLGVRLELLHR